MILDFESFTRKGLLADLVLPVRTWREGGDDEAMSKLFGSLASRRQSMESAEGAKPERKLGEYRDHIQT